MKSFDVPIIYRSPLISAIKKKRKDLDRMKKDFSPTLLDFGPVQIYLARHFGFCYGVENAIEIAFRTVDENPDRNIYLLSEMIHNPQVNADLQSHGVKFLQDTYGKQLIPFDVVGENDIVIIPAFGTTLETESLLRSKGIQVEKYDTTCPFVEKVWNRSDAIAKENYTIIIHGKPAHEETRATFSHASVNAPSVVINDMAEARILADFILGRRPPEEFYSVFKGQYSRDFDVTRHFERIGVVNQTTMLASDTQAIANFLRETMIRKYEIDENSIQERFADTRDTLCYATNDNQSAVIGMINTPANLAIVVGGYNSSNTSHLVELCEERLPTYFISSEDKIISQDQILHFDIHEKKEFLTNSWLSGSVPEKILITSGASCPDALVEDVIAKIAGFFHGSRSIDELVKQFSNDQA